MEPSSKEVFDFLLYFVMNMFMYGLGFWAAGGFDKKR